MQLLRVSKRSLWLMSFLLGGFLVLLPFQSRESLYVLVPVFIALWSCGYCIVKVWVSDHEIPVLDIGVFCVIFTTLYTVIPLLNYYFGGLGFGPLSDGRLQRQSPSPEEMGLFFCNHLVYLVTLTLAYLFFRKSNRFLPRFQIIPPSLSTLKVLVFFFVGFFIYFSVLSYGFGIGFKSGYGDESLVVEGPLLLQQINGKLSGIQFPFQVALIAFLVLNKNVLWARWLLFFVLGLSLFVTFAQSGSRGELMSLLLLAFLFWHRFHGVPLKVAFTFPAVLIALFTFLGLYRSFGSLHELDSALESFRIFASATNEFQAILGTGMDVNNMIQQSANIPFILYFNDFTPLLPPQQTLPFQKISAADWYVIQIGHGGTGVGFMWSVISQSLIGFGKFELFVRGLILGWFLAFLHSWYQYRYIRFLPTVIYVIMCLGTLWTFRDTTGSILWLIWWSLIPFVLIIYALGGRTEFMKCSFPGLKVRHRSQMSQHDDS